MAASIFPSQKGEEFKEQFLTCTICYEPYDSGEHQAKCLPCLHTFCLSCLQSHACKRQMFNCPECRKEITLSDGTVDSLHNNFVVENLREYQDIVNLTVYCGSCDDGSQAVSFCHDCGCFLCQDCAHYHEKLRPLRHHKLSTLNELQKQKHQPRKDQVCQKHSTQILNLYCKDAACKLPLCASCGLVDHWSHELVDLTAAIDEIIVEIKQSSATVNGKTKELDKIRETIETNKNKLTLDSEQKIKDIDELENELINLIKSKCSQATSRVNQLCDTEINILSSKIELIDNFKVQITSACKFANKACDMNHPTQLLSSQHQIVDRLRELEKLDLSETTSDKLDITFTENHQLALNQIQESVKHLLDIQGTRIIRADQKGSDKAERKPTRIDPKQCTIQLGIPGSINGLMKAIVQTVDTNEQIMTTGGANVEVAEHGFGSYDVHDNQDGTYSFEYYYSGQFSVNINDTPMIGNPFNRQ